MIHYKIILKSGKEIILPESASLKKADHIYKYYYKSAKELKVGDFIPVSICSSNNISKEEFTISEDLAWCLGLLVGDGSYATPRKSAFRVDLCNMEDECGDHYRDVISRELNVKITKVKTKNRSFVYYFHSKKEREKLVDIGLLYATGENKEVPFSIFYQNDRTVASFICGFIDSDGHCAKGGLTICNISKKALLGVQLLLLKIGFRSKIVKEKRAYKLFFHTKQSLLFLEKYGNLFRAKNKYKNLAHLKRLRPYRLKPQFMDVLILRDDIQELKMELSNLYPDPFNRKGRIGLQRSLTKFFGFDQYRIHSSYSIEFIVNTLDRNIFNENNPALLKLRDFYNKQIVFDSIKEILTLEDSPTNPITTINDVEYDTDYVDLSNLSWNTFKFSPLTEKDI